VRVCVCVCFLKPSECLPVWPIKFQGTLVNSADTSNPDTRQNKQIMTNVPSINQPCKKKKSSTLIFFSQNFTKNVLLSCVTGERYNLCGLGRITIKICFQALVLISMGN